MLRRMFRVLLLTGVSLGFQVHAQDAIFGGNGGNFEDRFTQPDSDADAARFLTQATFGPTPSAVSSLRSQGFQSWFDQQRLAPITSSRAYLDALTTAGVTGLGQNQRVDRWFHTAAFGNDQLRQRMAFALSQILVVSDQVDALSGDHFGTSEYWDILARNGLGNYRTLLEEVTRSPMMGRYLSHFRNRKANPSGSIQPDENYAREVMQLFTIGLIERNLNFTPVLDINNQPLPTYDQSQITELARVFTGWSYRCAASQTTCDTYRGLTTGTNAVPNGYQPMACFPAFMDHGAKTIFGGIVLPAAGVTCGANNTSGGLPDTTGTPTDVNVQNQCRAYCETQMVATMDYLFNHPNTAPFISRQLIQRLVTSNPSPEYIERVATVFENNGSGVRGDLMAVARAILLDEEARIPPIDPAAPYGKVREPLLKLTAVWRALGVTAPAAGTGGEIQMGIRSPQTNLLQRPLGAPTVFNFYEPDYQQPGAIATADLYSPEFQIMNETTLVTASNEMWNRIYAGYSTSSGAFTLPTTAAYLSFADLSALAANSSNATSRAQLLDALNVRLLYGTMSPQLRAVLDNMLRFDLVSLDGNRKVLDLVHLIAISPEFAVQR
ncbi:hypothetical protein C7S18_00920 [Ahniella affigens]|uniref:DUF1800 domain-containing protein n=1 Tax=Ahniella affigens TaxID=2021234 RepID=A0A2P1PLX5_9GAMM|nr:DUF1800 domain-containing protein [Ahniella affigens]AVP95845.1 hypothetical protein C7S18_00920 [Ahniella affigens]